MMFDLMILVACYLVLQMLGVWVISMHYKNPSIVDLSWPIGLMVSGLIYIWAQNITQLTYLVSIFLIAWALRLAFYLWYTRIRVGTVDKRYEKISADWKLKSLGFLLNFQLQGLLIYIIAIVFLFTGARYYAGLTWLDLLACVMILIGFMGEASADYQLEMCKKGNKKICNIGLWRYSRHPNYFFDWLTWCGFTLFSIQYPYGLIAIISPLTLYIIFTRVTGPLTEKGSIESRGKAYLDYQRHTNMFFPGPKH